MKMIICQWYKETHNISHPNMTFWCNCADSKITLGVDLVIEKL